MKSRIFISSLALLFSYYCFAQSNIEKIKQGISSAQRLENRMKYDSASYFYYSASELALQIDDSVLYNYIKRKIGRLYITKGDSDSAKMLLTEVWNFAFRNKNDTLRAQSENSLGWIFMDEKLMANALNYYESALSISEKEEDTVGLFTSYFNLSNYYNDQAEFNSSLEYALKSIQTAESKKLDRNDYMKAILNLGNVYEKFELYDSALNCYEKVYSYSIKNENINLAFKSVYNKALVFTRLAAVEIANNDIEKANGYYSKAKNLYEQLIDIIEPVSDYRNTALLYNSLGILYKKQGNIAEAKEYYNQALKFAGMANDLNNKVRILKNIGMLYRKQGDFKTAEKYFNESLALADSTDYKLGEMEAYNSLAVLYDMMGNYKESNNYLAKYINLYKSIIHDEKIKTSNEMLFAFEREKDKERIKDLVTQKTITDLEKKTLSAERNTTIGISITVVFLLILILFYFRMKARKNRVIAAQRIRQLEDEKKLLAAQSLMVGQENERKRIAQELHDGIGVLLSTASIHFSSVSKTSKDKKTIEMLGKAEQLLKQAGGEVRKISQNMMPVVLSKFGLLEALEDMFEKLDELEEIDVTASFTGSKARLPENTEIMLYRIIQEMVNNTLKHAKANNIEFSYSKGNGTVLIDYKDDGIGFDIAKLPRNSSLGVFGIQSRIDFLKGELTFESGIGKGTYYHVSIPVNKNT